MKQRITIIDSTLRDGSHALAHQVNRDFIAQYATGAEKSAVPYLVVGHGNGLGASSVHLGQSLLSDKEMIAEAKRHVRNTKIAGFLIPGFGSVSRDVIPAIEAGMEALFIACHCTEANITRKQIEYASSRSLAVFGVLMMSHMLDADGLLHQAKLMESYGAGGVILMDSAGAYTPKRVAAVVSAVSHDLHIPVGFHPHNNLGLAVANAVAAVDSGARIIDATSRGLGAGAGNCPLEAVVAVLQAEGYETGTLLYPLLDNGDFVASSIGKVPQMTSETLVSGLAGVFSGFVPHVRKAAETYGVDVRDILVELGKRRVVAGQEDMIIEVAQMLRAQKKGKPKDFMLESLT